MLTVISGAGEIMPADTVKDLFRSYPFRL